MYVYMYICMWRVGMYEPVYALPCRKNVDGNVFLDLKLKFQQQIFIQQNSLIAVGLEQANSTTHTEGRIAVYKIHCNAKDKLII